MINHATDNGGSAVIGNHLHVVKDWDQNVMLTEGLTWECGRVFL